MTDKMIRMPSEQTVTLNCKNEEMKEIMLVKAY